MFVSMPELDPAQRALLFGDARSHSAWLDRPVPDALLRELWELVKMGPTGANSQPIRLLFVRSSDAKARLERYLSPGNRGRVVAAPVTAVVAYDTAFYELFPRLYPIRPGTREYIAGLPEAVRDRMGFQSATLEAGYLILAARSLGLDVGPMGGFDAPGVDKEFFPDSTLRSTLLVNLGYGDPAKVHPRLPRLDFADVAKLV